jgi:hypothetical protein
MRHDLIFTTLVFAPLSAQPLGFFDVELRVSDAGGVPRLKAKANPLSRLAEWVDSSSLKLWRLKISTALLDYRP